MPQLDFRRGNPDFASPLTVSKPPHRERAEGSKTVSGKSEYERQPMTQPVSLIGNLGGTWQFRTNAHSTSWRAE